MFSALRRNTDLQDTPVLLWRRLENVAPDRAALRPASPVDGRCEEFGNVAEQMEQVEGISREKDIVFWKRTGEMIDSGPTAAAFLCGLGCSRMSRYQAPATPARARTDARAECGRRPHLLTRRCRAAAARAGGRQADSAAGAAARIAGDSDGDVDESLRRRRHDRPRCQRDDPRACHRLPLDRRGGARAWITSPEGHGAMFLGRVSSRYFRGRHTSRQFASGSSVERLHVNLNALEYRYIVLKKEELEEQGNRVMGNTSQSDLLAEPARDAILEKCL
ncbi:hypothetical protein DFH08DRAFT_827149 [Mycena albidolilacea]|uniref:Uncharacterized protein n=1 Tax=Mycena albidolilacea TaxID=1033008 RepID=A0AAD7E7K8_9AGAR|nr:hypothetical protein DFH08DRAFT_827149 [Mycena albidolilacea]